ncbi:MAG: putative metal-binding motif-containing protein [Proteobacteria bacterium]|nr:putative metal-binding motif-containing protein [Pseudomonadota bacterium]
MRILLPLPLLLLLLLSGCLYNEDAYNDQLNELTDHDGDGVIFSRDCDDSDATRYPGAEEIPADGIDQDCNGVEDCYVDRDNDTFGKNEIVAGNDMDCTNRIGEADNPDDCDDSDDEIYPGAPDEKGDGYDMDCDDTP